MYGGMYYHIEKEMKNMLIVSPCDLPVPAVQGGAVQTLIDSIINSNEKNPKFKFTVISSYNKEAYKKSQQYKYTRFVFVKHNVFFDFVDKSINQFMGLMDKSRKLRKCDYLWKLKIIAIARKLLSNEVYDEVLLQNYGYFTKIFKKNELLEKYKGHIFYHLHNDIPDSVNPEIIKKCKCILISKYLSKKIVDNYGLDMKENLLILNNGIPIEKYINRLTKEERIELRRTLGFSEKDKIVCFVGRINPSKGILELLEAMKKISDSTIKLLVIGATEFGNNVKSDFEVKIKRICEELSDRVKSTGYIPHEEIWKYYQISDMAALPSMWEEPAGLTILEALVSRLPVITTNAGGIPEFMKEEFGFMLNRDEYLVDNIADKIQSIANDLSTWEKNGIEASKYIINNYSEEKYFQNFVDLINMNGR